MAQGSITVELTTDIIYVAGTVNGRDTVFIQDDIELIKWRATVDVADDDIYDIRLKMYDEAGNIGEYSSVIEYILPSFVYDRTQADVDEAEMMISCRGIANLTSAERQQWLAGLKGCLNRSDLKRIENDIYVISSMLQTGLASRKDCIPDIPDREYFDALLNDVNTLRNVGYRYSDTPTVPVQPINTYSKLNDIEHILHDIYYVYMTNYKYYAGDEIYCGDSIGAVL